jgi:FkbM family methyltransferase
LVFVDDDNVLDPDFLEVALRVAEEKPFLGSWSGQCRPGLEEEPPEWSRRYFGNLVLREFEEDRWSNLPRLASTMPCGAGLCVRRAVARHYLDLHDRGARRFRLDRTGGSLLSGGDNDLAACACDVGLGVGLIAALRLTHLIPPERFTVDYHVRLAEGIHYSSVILDAERGIVAPPRMLLGRLADRLRTARLAQPHRRIAAAAYRGRERAASQLRFDMMRDIKKQGPTLADLRHRAVLAAKRALYGSRGEPYEIAGRTLRYIPGTRPVRTHYVNSINSNTRYDALQVELFAKHLSEGDVAIDIGAHAGQYCVLMAAMCGRMGQVIAFEPDPYARERLDHNLALNPGVKRVRIEALAVSDQPGEAVLYSRGGNSQSSLARTGIGEEAARTSEQFRVPLVRLDDYIAENGLPTPRWVKIDAEGAEIRILQGAPKLLASEANIVCELHPYAWTEFGNTFFQLKMLAAQAGRRIRYLDQETEAGDDAEYGSVLLERIP